MEANPKRDEKDIEILKFLQGDIPVETHPYAKLSKIIGISEEETVSRIRVLLEKGDLRRMGALLNHTIAGYTVNSLTAWNVTPQTGETYEEAWDRIGRVFSSFSFVSHCYVRKTPPDWIYPVFAMIHAKTEDILNDEIELMKQTAKTYDCRIMRTKREWKKTSMHFF